MLGFKNFLEEQVEVESILKYYPSPREVKYIRSVRHKLIMKNPDMKPIGDDKLHVTLAGGAGWHGGVSCLEVVISDSLFGQV